jgi:hypothetical protein
MRSLLAASLVVAAVPAFAHAAERGTAKATVAGKAVTIEYGRPELKGRDMLAQATVGTPWRMGADAATTLTTEAGLSFGATKVPAGEYVLRATKGEGDKWTMNVHKKGSSGAGEKVADVPLAPSKLDASVEAFTIDLTGSGKEGTLALKWGTTALGTRFTAE